MADMLSSEERNRSQAVLTNRRRRGREMMRGERRWTSGEFTGDMSACLNVGNRRFDVSKVERD
jgi:hypothetical protein